MSALNGTAMLAVAKAAAQTALEAGKIDLYNQVLALQQDMKEGLAETTRLTSENAELSRTIVQLRKELDDAKNLRTLRASLIFREDMYWRKENGEDNDDGPFCTRCMDADEKCIHLLKDGVGAYRCPQCKNKYHTKDYQPPMPHVSSSRSFGTF